MPEGKKRPRSISLDKELADFIENYLQKHRIERLKAGKDDSIISIVREGIFAWAEKEGVLEDLMEFLKQKR